MGDQMETDPECADVLEVFEEAFEVCQPTVSPEVFEDCVLMLLDPNDPELLGLLAFSLDFTDADGSEAVPPCDDPPYQLNIVQEVWCSDARSEYPDSAELNQLQDAIDTYLNASRCPELAARWLEVKPNVKIFDDTEIPLVNGGTVRTDDFMVIRRGRFSDPLIFLANTVIHELMHTLANGSRIPNDHGNYPTNPDFDPDTWLNFQTWLYSCTIPSPGA